MNVLKKLKKYGFKKSKFLVLYNGRMIPEGEIIENVGKQFQVDNRRNGSSSFWSMNIMDNCLIYVGIEYNNICSIFFEIDNRCECIYRISDAPRLGYISNVSAIFNLLPTRQKRNLLIKNILSR